MAVANLADVEAQVEAARRYRVAERLLGHAGALLQGPRPSLSQTATWLNGRHRGWEGLWGELESGVRDRLRRAACDLAFELEGSVEPAAEALMIAAAVISQEEE